jgi:hypothetical protein
VSQRQEHGEDWTERLKIPAWVVTVMYTGGGLGLASIPLGLLDSSERVLGVSAGALRDGLMFGGMALVLMTLPAVLWAVFKFERRARKLWSGELGPFCPHCDYRTGDYSVKACPECGETLERTLPGKRPVDWARPDQTDAESAGPPPPPAAPN